MTLRKLGVRLLCTGASVLFLAATARAQTESGASGSIETVVVTGTRLQAQEIKQDAPNVLDIRPTSEIQKLPDVDLAEALQRVPGVSLETDTGEGRFVNIRGMDADLNGTTFDGVRLTANNPSTPQGGARAVAFDVLPPGLFGGVEVIKSLTPDIDAEGIGGIVNVIPRTLPEGREFLVDASVGSGTETLRGSPVWDGQLTVGGRFGDRDQFSIIASYTYHEDWRGIDDIENSGPSTVFTPSGVPIDNDLEYRWYKYHRTRRGEGTSMSWDIDGSSQVFLRAFDAGYTEYAHKNRLEIDNTNVTCLDNPNVCNDPVTPTQNPNGSFTVNDASPLKEYTDSKETIESKLIEVGGTKAFADNILADLRLSWTEGHDLQPWSYKFEFSDPNPVAFNFNQTSNPNYPSFQTLDGTNLANPAIYTKSKLEVDGSDNMDTESAIAGNVTIPTAIAGYDGDFKVGFDMRLRVIRQNATEPGEIKGVGPMSQFVDGPDQIYYGNRYNIGPFVNFPELVALTNANTQQTIDPSQFQHNSEDVYAEYAQYSTTIGKLGLLGGVRVETTNAIYGAQAVDGNDNLLNPTTGLPCAPGANCVENNKQDYTNIFPDLNAKYQVEDDLIVRAAFTTSLARPGFNQITAAKTYDYDNDIISLGNPELKPTTSKNIDLTAEYYLPQGGVAAAGLFYKSFSNYIIPTTQTVAASSATSDPSINSQFTGTFVQINSFENIATSSDKGAELNYQQQFVFLPGAFSGFGFDGNVTFNDSDGNIRLGEGHALPQTSPWNYNAAVFFEKYGLNLRIGASYVSKNLWAVGPNASQDLYSQPRFRLDFGSSYTFMDHYEFYFDVKNITNTKLEFTQTPSAAYPVQREFYDSDFFFGVRAHF